MKTSRFILAFLCALLVTVPAGAQLNLNNLKNKAKNAVKQEVAKQNSTTTQTTEPGEQPAARPSEQKQQEKLKPSAAAIAADPGASEQTTREGYSKPTCEIRAAYEHLDPALFIYQPYYKGDNRYCYYVEAETDVTEFHNNCYAWFLMKAQEEYGVHWTSINYFVGGLSDYPDRMVPYGEHTMHAGFAEVMADPFSSMTFNHFLRACSIMEISALAALSMKDYNREVKDKDGKVTKLVEAESDRIARYRRMRAEVERFVLANSPFGLIEFMADWIWDRYQQRQKKNQFVVMDYFEYQEVFALLSSHPDVTARDEATRTKCEASVKKHKLQYDEVNAKALEYYGNNARKADQKAREMKMEDMPNPAMRDANMEAQMVKLASSSGHLSKGTMVLKAIIQSAGWNYDRNEIGRIIDRYKNAYIVYKATDGKVHMVTMSFKQDFLGGDSWGSLMARGLGLDNRTIVDYK